MSVCKVILLGRLGNNPELRTLESGSKVCTFSLATSESYKDKEGQKQERTEWHNIVLWAKLAELADSYLSKGREVYIEGKLQTRKWQDQNGNDRYTTEIVGTNINFVGSNSNDSTPNTGNSTFATTEGIDKDDLPF